MERPKVSVIIPVYNTQEFIEQTIQCISAQTLRQIEIIVVNDGSTDDSLRIVERMAREDDRLRVITQPNQGQAVARNAAFDVAVGEYVYFMDSDDLLSEDALERCYDRCRRDDLDFVFFDADIFGDSGLFSPTYYHRTATLEDRVYEGVDILRIQIDGCGFKAPLWLNLIKRSYLERIGVRGLRGMKHEDELWMALVYLQAERVGFITESFFKRRFRENSIMTSRLTYRNIDDYFVVAAHLKAFAGQHPDRATVETVDRFVTKMINAAIYKAHALPCADRSHIALRAMAHYSRQVTLRNLMILIFKQPLDKLRQSTHRG